MTERCESCTDDRAVSCDAIRAMFRYEVEVDFQDGFISNGEIDNDTQSPRLNAATKAFLKGLKELQCTLKLEQRYQTLVNEMFAAGTLTVVKHLESDAPSSETAESDIADFLEGIEEVLDETTELIQASAIAQAAETSGKDVFATNLYAGVRYLHAKDYCELQGWDLQSLSPEQSQEIAEHLTSLGLPPPES